MSENVIVLRGFEPAKFAQDVLLVAGEATSLTKRTDLGRSVAALLEVAALCLNQDGVEPYPDLDVEAKLKAAGFSWNSVRSHLGTIINAARYADNADVDQGITGFLAGWNALTGDDLALCDPLPMD